jgi:hypothetical protein
MKHLSHCALLSLVFALRHNECDAFSQQQTKISNSLNVATDSFGQQRQLLPHEHLTASGTALSMGLVEDFVAGSDEKTRNKGNEKYLATLQERVDRINGLEETIEDLGDEELQAKTDSLRQRLKNGEDINGPLLEEAFAVVREAAW